MKFSFHPYTLPITPSYNIGMKNFGLKILIHWKKSQKEVWELVGAKHKKTGAHDDFFASYKFSFFFRTTQEVDDKFKTTEKKERERKWKENENVRMLPVVVSGIWHHLWILSLSIVRRFSGFGTRIFLMKLSDNVSSLLHGVIIVYLFSFHARYSLHPIVGSFQGSSEIREVK